MKLKGLFIILIILFFGCNEDKIFVDSAIISGTIINSPNDTLNIQIDRNIKGLENEKYQVVLDNNGNYKVELPIDDWQLGTLSIKNEWIIVFLEPGDRIFVNSDINNFKQSLKIEGKNSGNTKYFNESYATFENNEALADNRIKTKTINTGKDFKTYRDRIKERHFKFYKANADQLTENAKKVALAQIIFRWANKIFDYPTIHLFLNNKETTPNFEVGYHNFINELNFNDNKLLKYYKYVELLDNYLDHLLKKQFLYTDLKYNHSNTYDPYYKYHHLYELADKHLDDSVKFAMQSYYIVSAIQRGRFLTVESKYEEFIDKSNGLYKEAVLNAHQKAMTLEKGKKAPDFIVKSINDENIKLSDFKGNVIYIDFWASWCVSCIKLIPDSKSLKSLFKNEDIIFLNISIDDNEASWRNAVGKYKIEGINSISPASTSKLIEMYNAKALPRYFLIDKVGNIVDPDAKKPNNPDIIREIRSLLDK